ncbi:MAG: Flp pilus assembly protein CpaB, partial [Burkholderiales bacterium]
PGKRAVTIPVDQISSLSGMLGPGDVIDLYVSFEHRGRRLTAPLLSEVQVLATGRQVASADEVAGAQPSEYATVTLETTSAEAVKLVAARQDGAITAVLSTQGAQGGNSRSDGAAARGAGHLAGLLGLEQPGAPAPIPVIYGDRLMSVEPADPIDAESGAPDSATWQFAR